MSGKAHALGLLLVIPATVARAQNLESAQLGISSTTAPLHWVPDQTSPTRYGTIGGISGAIVGGALGYFRMRLFCETQDCGFPTRSVLTGAAIGAGVGIFVEYAIRDPRWHRQRSELDAVTIRVVRDTTRLEQHDGAVGFENAVVITNATARQVYLGPCDPDVQRQVGKAWVTAWTPICGGGFGGSLMPGESSMSAVRVYGFADGKGLPSAEGLVPGTYRFVYRMGFGQVGVDPHPRNEFRTSPSFVVR